MLDAQLGIPSPKCLPLTCYIILSMLFHVSAPLLPIYKMELIFTTRWNHKNCSQQLWKALKTWYKTPMSVSSWGATTEPGSCCTALHAALPPGLVQHQQHTLQHGTAPSPPTDQNYFNPQWLLLLCPTRLKPLTTPSLHSRLKWTPVSRCKIKAPPPPARARFRCLQLKSWKKMRRTGIQQSCQCASKTFGDYRRKIDLHFFTRNSPSLHLALRSETQVKPRLLLDRELDSRACKPWEQHHNRSKPKQGNIQGKSYLKKKKAKTKSSSLQIPIEQWFGLDDFKK